MAEQEVYFELAQVEHAQAILDFLEAVAQETDYLLLDQATSDLTLQQMQDNLARRQELPNHLCLLALLGEEVIGMVNLAGFDDYKINHIVDLFIAVKKAYWGYGLGTALMDNALDWVSQTEGLHRVELTVQTRNQAAYQLYKTFGFTVEGTKEKAIKTAEGDYADLYQMAIWIEDK